MITTNKKIIQIINKTVGKEAIMKYSLDIPVLFPYLELA